MLLSMHEKFTSFCQVLKEMRTTENWFISFRLKLYNYSYSYYYYYRVVHMKDKLGKPVLER